MLLYVVPDARFFVTHRLPLALAARDAGYDVHVATPEGAEVERIAAAGLPWHRVRFGPMRRKPWSDLQSLLDVVRLYRRLRPALVHHVTFKAILHGTIAARLSGVRGVVNAMTGMGDVFSADSPMDRMWRRVIVALFKIFVRHERMIVIAQNVEDLELMISNGFVRGEQTRLIRGSGVDPGEFVPAGPHAHGDPVVAFVGRVIEPKGIVEFAAAARRLHAEGVRVRFVVAGARDDGSGRGIPARIFDEWIARGDIEYLGLRDDVRGVYAGADVVCLPSWGEGVPKALIEAASCALPIVATDVPGCRDIVRHGENGLLVPRRQIEPLAEAIRTLIGDPALRRRMGARGREIVVEELSLRHVVDATLKVYEELV